MSGSLLTVALLFAVACVVALIGAAAVGWLAFSRAAESSQPRGVRQAARGCLGSALVGFAVMVVVLTVMSEPYRHPERHVEAVAARGESVVRALEAFEARHGRPATTLHELVPEFLAAVPSSDYAPDPDFDYALLAGDAGAAGWRLSVDCAFLEAQRNGVIRYESRTRRWEYAP